VLLIGLGVVGALHAAYVLGRDPGADFAAIAEGERARRIAERGISVEGVHYSPATVAPGDARPADLVLVAVKGPQLPAAIADLGHAVGPGTIVVSLLNGITSERLLRAAFPDAYVPTAMTDWSLGVVDGDVRKWNEGRVFVGDAAPGLSPQAEATGRLLAGYGIPCQVTAEAVREQWKKLLVNISVNQVEALYTVRHGAVQVRGSRERDLLLGLQREVMALSDAMGVGLTEEDLADVLAYIDRLAPEGLTSTAADALAGRPLEIDAFAGEVARLGRQHGVATPLNDMVLRKLGGTPTSP
jgi:2-dehydropantoate 2-reductase